MESSLRGVLITSTLILIFITCIVNFIVLFPQEQGVVFTDVAEQTGYLTISDLNDSITADSLNSLSNSSENAFNQWDVTQGFMGSNQMKQGQTGVSSSVTQVFSSMKIIIKELFTENSPIMYVFLILSTLAGIYVVYMIYKFVRTGS